MLAFGNALKNIGLNSVLDSNDPNTAYNDFEGTFVDLFNLFFPPTPIKTSRRNCPIEDWMTKGLLISRNAKFRLFSISKSFPTLPNISLYKTYRNIFNSTVRTAKKLHYEKLFHKSKFNLKETWSLFNKAINKKPKKTNKISPPLKSTTSLLLIIPKWLNP